jgi:hypothetical protein
MNQNFAVHTLGKGLQIFLNILFFFIFIFSLIQTFSLPAVNEAGPAFWLIILTGFTAVFFAALLVYSGTDKGKKNIPLKQDHLPGVALMGVFSLLLSFCTFLISLISSKDVSSLLAANPFLLITLNTSSPGQNAAADSIAGWLVNGSALMLAGISVSLLCGFLWYVLSGSKAAANGQLT